MSIALRPIAYDSMGVRSMATYISTPDINVMIDPSVSLAPRRFGLPPHELEVKALLKYADDIKNYLSLSDVVIITHYHYDHHDPGKLIPIELFKSKKVIVKDPLKNINTSQRIRAAKFLKLLRNVATVDVGDGKEFTFGKTRIKISKPIQHGNTSKLGYVVMVVVEYEGGSVGFSSDVEGPLDPYVYEFLSGVNIAIVDGPPTYLVSTSYNEDDIKVAINILSKLSLSTQTLVVDHHLLRDIKYYMVMDEVRRSSGVRPLTAAEFLGLEPLLLEARRKELYREYSLRPKHS